MYHEIMYVYPISNSIDIMNFTYYEIVRNKNERTYIDRPKRKHRKEERNKFHSYRFLCILIVVNLFLDAATLTEDFSILFPQL